MGLDQLTLICLTCIAGSAVFVAILLDRVAADLARIKDNLEIRRNPSMLEKVDTKRTISSREEHRGELLARAA